MQPVDLRTVIRKWSNVYGYRRSSNSVVSGEIDRVSVDTIRIVTSFNKTLKLNEKMRFTCIWEEEEICNFIGFVEDIKSDSITVYIDHFLKIGDKRLTERFNVTCDLAVYYNNYGESIYETWQLEDISMDGARISKLNGKLPDDIKDITISGKVVKQALPIHMSGTIVHVYSSTKEKTVYGVLFGDNLDADKHDLNTVLYHLKLESEELNNTEDKEQTESQEE